jgi:hypothetical protein
MDPNGVDSESPWCQFVQQATVKDDDHNFRKALESSLFPVFLKKGAERTCKVYCDADSGLSMAPAHELLQDKSWDAILTGFGPATSKYPCTRLITALFRHKCSHRYSKECLGSLQDFLAGSPEEVKLQVEEILSTIQGVFHGLAKEKTEPARLTFFARISQKIIAKGNEAGLEMEMLVPDLLSIFTGGAGSALVDMIRNKDASTASYLTATPPRKRRYNSSLIPPGQRLKLDRPRSAQT